MAVSTYRRDRNQALRKIQEHKVKRAWHLARGNDEKARRHLIWKRRWQKRAQVALRELRAHRAKPSHRAIKCAPIKRTWTSVKRWFTRPPIKPRVIILHSTESSPGSGFNISSYLSHGSTQADCHLVIDTDGTTYRLVPDGRKAWHVAHANGYTLGIEQVGRAAQESWPDAQVRAAACQAAKWARKYGIPAKFSPTHGVAYHRSVSGPGGHWDPGYHYAIEKFLRYMREYLGE